MNFFVKRLKTVKTKKAVRSVFSDIFCYIMLIVLGYIVIYPLFYMISGSVKPMSALLDIRHLWLPRYVSLAAFTKAAEYLDFVPSLMRTLSLQVVSALIEVFTCSVAAYGFARFKFRGKSAMTVLLLLSLIIPLPMYSMPLSVNYRVFGIFNTNWVYWLPALLGGGVRSGMLIYIYIQFFIGLPKELEDAAYIDGAGPLRTFLQIALPSSGVVIVTVSVLSLVWHWNESFLSSLCFLNKTRPLSVMMENIEVYLHFEGLYIGVNPIASSYVFAACIMFVAIPLIVYLFLQRKFVKSIDRVGITG